MASIFKHSVEIVTFFSIKSNLHYTNKQRAHSIKIKKIHEKITTHGLKLTNYFISQKVVKLAKNAK